VSAWELVFLQSKVNNGTYVGELLPAQNWEWPQQTWFQKRLRALRTVQRQKFLQKTKAEKNELLEAGCLN
jgi:hypothetical protein